MDFIERQNSDRNIVAVGIYIIEFIVFLFIA